MDAILWRILALIRASEVHTYPATSALRASGELSSLRVEKFMGGCAGSARMDGVPDGRRQFDESRRHKVLL